MSDDCDAQLILGTESRTALFSNRLFWKVANSTESAVFCGTAVPKRDQKMEEIKENEMEAAKSDEENAETRNKKLVNWLMDPKMHSILIAAITKESFVETVKSLIELGADKNAVDEDGDNLLFLATLQGRTKNDLEQLVTLGLDWKIRNKKQRSILHYAVQGGDPEVVKYFIFIEADITARNENGMTPLLSTANATKNFLELVNVLKDKADMNEEDDNGENLMFVATWNGKSPKELEQLIEWGCIWDTRNLCSFNILHVAAVAGNVEALKYFINKGADLTAKNYFGHTPLLSTAFTATRFLHVVDVLLENGADKNDTLEPGDNLLLMAVLFKKPLNDLKGLVDRGFDLNARGHNGDSILHAAVHKGNVEVVNYFISKGLDVNVENNDGVTPLIIAGVAPITDNFEKMVNILLRHEATRTATDERKNNVLFLAVFHKKSLHELEFLVNHGFTWDITNDQGRSILHVAVAVENVDALKFFLSKGAAVDARDDDGLTPLLEAALCADRFQQVLNVLCDHGADVFAEDNVGRNLLSLAVFQQKPLNEIVYLVGLGIPWISRKTGHTILHYAADRGSVDVMEYFIKEKGEVNKPNNSGVTPLLYAASAENNFLKRVEMLIRHGAELNHEDEYGSNLIFLAVSEFKAVADIEQLVKLGAAWNRQNARAQTILHVAVKRGHLEALKYFIVELGADVNAKTQEDRTPIFYSAYSDAHFTESVNLCLDNNADVNVVDKDGNSPLFFATASGKSVPELKILIDRGANWELKNKDNRTILHCAVDGERVKVLTYFLDKGAQVNAKDLLGYTPLLYAADMKENFLEFVKLLVGRGSNINEVDKTGNNLLFMATLCGRSANDLKKLVDLGASWDTVNFIGSGILHLAAARGNLEALNYFISQGADVNLKDSNEITPLLKSLNATTNFLEVVKLLKENGGNIDVVDKLGNNLLLYTALEGKSPSELEQLETWGCKWEVINAEGASILHMAVAGGNLETIRYAISKKLSVNAKDNDGRSPLTSAVRTKQNFSEIVDLLVEHKADVNAADSNGANVLYYAAICGRSVKELEKLEKCGTSWKMKTKRGDTILHYFAAIGNPDSLNFFLNKEMEDNAQKYFILSAPLSDKSFMHKMQKIQNKRPKSAHARSKRKKFNLFGQLWKRKPALPPIDEDSVSEMLTFFIKKGANINARNLNGSTPIQNTVWAEENFRVVVDLLVRHGADINSVDNSGANLVFNAALEGRSKEDIAFLIGLGAKLNTLNHQGDSILHCGAKGGNVEVLRYLLKLGADPNARNFKEETPLLHALKNTSKNFRNTLKVLLEADMKSIDNRGNPMVIPPSEESWLQLDQLVELGQTFQSPGGLHGSVLHLAAAKGWADVARYLIFHGADVNGKCKNGDSPLTKAIKHATTGFCETVKVLVDYGADVKLVDKEGNSPFHVAAALGWRTIGDLECLGSLNCDWKGDNAEGQDALQVFQETQDFDALRHFLSC